MSEVIDDIVMPSELIIKDDTGESFSGSSVISGALLFMSGGKLHFAQAGMVEKVTSLA